MPFHTNRLFPIFNQKQHSQDSSDMELNLESPDIIYYDTYGFTGQIKVCVWLATSSPLAAVWRTLL